MSEVITLSSSEDESVDKSPPKKRIKPTPVLANLPHISITKVKVPFKPQQNKEAIVLVCSDDDDEVSYVATKNFTEIENVKKIEENKVLKLEDDEVRIIEVNQNIQEIKDDVKISHIANSELPRDLEDSCEIINEDSLEESSGKENKVSDLMKDNIQTCSSSGKFFNRELLGKFLKVVDEQTNEEKYKVIKNKFILLWNCYSKCETDLGDSMNFKNMLLSNTQKAEKSTALAVISFNDVYQHLNETSNAECIEVEKDDLPKLKKLEKTIRKLTGLIKHLEEEEVDFEEGENSAYFKLEKYMARLDKVYKIYCQMLKKNPYSGRITHSKLVFVDSEFNEINRAISRKYKNNQKFPSYYEMKKFIEKVNDENKLGLSVSKIKTESEHCFKKLGELLQTRRRKDLYDSHYMLLKDGEDPAKADLDLNKILEKSYIEGQEKIGKVVQEYANQETTGGPELEEDQSDVESDKSSSSESEDDEEGEDKKKNGTEDKKSNGTSN